MELLFAASEIYGWFTGHFQLQFAWWTGNLLRGIDHSLDAALNADHRMLRLDATT